MERVQLRAALDRDRDDLAGLQLDLVPADGDRRPDLALSDMKRPSTSSP
ncbi:MAG: hypothetical protein M5R40_20025 [Anaerolineae bacterium]|nr:hypothetical protein [Anaerolineae bacterium]